MRIDVLQFFVSFNCFLEDDITLACGEESQMSVNYASNHQLNVREEVLEDNPTFKWNPHVPTRKDPSGRPSASRGTFYINDDPEQIVAILYDQLSYNKHYENYQQLSVRGEDKGVDL